MIVTQVYQHSGLKKVRLGRASKHRPKLKEKEDNDALIIADRIGVKTP
jgi:hypothetical protein